ncbi:MAG: alpha/beta hydrolase, partial [Clostridia bacterium]|nr:alpha/beta hydrolase [Clostridia bacterium]
MKILTETKKIPLNYEELGLIRDSEDAYYDAFILKSEPLELHATHPCIVVCPGGAYKSTAPREAEHIATQFIAKGFSAYILRYSCNEAKFPCALTELSWLIAHIREHAEENHIDPDRIAVVGFSAGGHLVGSLGAYWNDPEIQQLADVNGEENKPNG